MHTAGNRITHLRYRRRSGLAKGVSCALRAVFVAVMGLSVPCTYAADTPSGSGGAAPAGPHSSVVKPGLYRIDGEGGTTLLRADAKSMIVIDSKRVGSYGALMQEIRRVARSGDRPIGALVLTAAGSDQTGNVAQFTAAGVPVIVQRRALALLKAPVPVASGGTAARPYIAYDTDYLLHVGDLEAEVEHVGSGRSGADSVVYFRDLRAVAVGGLFTHEAPEPDCASGGSFAGWAAAIAHLMYFDFDVAVPSRGAAVGRSELLALKAKLEALAQSTSTSGPVSAGCRPPR